MSPRYHDTFGHGHLPSRVSHSPAGRLTEESPRTTFDYFKLAAWIVTGVFCAAFWTVIALWAWGVL